MPAVASSSNLVELIQTLHEQQQQHADSTAAIAETLEMQQRQQEQDAAAIAATLSRLSGLLSSLLGGFAPAAKTLAAAAPVSAKAAPAAKAAASSGKPGRRGRAPRGTFAQSGLESVLAFVKKHGNPSSADVAKHWSTEGRGGKADNTLGQLVKDKKIKRSANVTGRGSRYAAL